MVLLTGVRSITNLILTPGLINLDFADVNSVMKDQGLALMGVGEAAGDGRAERAVRAALKNPLLESTDISEARGVLVSFCGSGDLSLYEVEEALAELREQLSPDAQIIFGATFDDSLGKSLRISLVVTGLSQTQVNGRAFIILSSFHPCCQSLATALTQLTPFSAVE